MNDKKEVIRCLELLNKFPENVDWLGFSDRGNPCYNPYKVSSEEWNKEVDCRAAVMKTMPKYSTMHLSLSRRVADTLGNQYITYPWLTKTLGRIIATTESYSDLENGIYLSIAVKRKMKEKGLETITSIEEVFSIN